MIVMNGEEFLSAQEACNSSASNRQRSCVCQPGGARSYRQGIKRTRLYRRDDVEQLTRLRAPDEEADEQFRVTTSITGSPTFSSRPTALPPQYLP